jgi:hypothetical protein
MSRRCRELSTRADRLALLPCHKAWASVHPVTPRLSDQVTVLLLLIHGSDMIGRARLHCTMHSHGSASSGGHSPGKPKQSTAGLFVTRQGS